LSLTDNLALAYYREYDEAVLDTCEFLLNACPPDISQDARHKGYEPTLFGGDFPAAAAFEMPFEDEPRRTDNSMMPGIINIGFRIYLPSMISTGQGFDSSPRSGAQLEAMRLHGRWREGLFGDPVSGNFNMQGRVHRLSLVRGEAGDMSRLGFALAVDYADDGTETILWVHHTDVRVEL
jgi:hypothetical protein